MKTKKSDKEKQFFDECPIVNGWTDAKMMGLYQLKGMCWMLDNHPDLRRTCPDCKYFKDIPPNSFGCRRFYCTNEKT